METNPDIGIECRSCSQRMDSSDCYCRKCGAPASGQKLRGAPLPTPEQAAGYWRYFFRPFFIAAFIFFGGFFAAALVLIVI